MSSLNQGGSVPSTMAAASADQSTQTRLTANEALTSLPHLNLDANAVQRDVNALLLRAGLERANDGSLQVKDTASVDRTGEIKDLSAAEQIYAAGETQLKPPAPPTIKLTRELQKGAEMFANNLDAVFNEVLPRVTELQSNAKLDLDRLTEGVVESAASQAAKEAMKTQRAVGNEAERLANAGVKPEARLGADGAVFAGANETKGTTGGLDGTKTPTVLQTAAVHQASHAIIQRLTELTADALLAAFLKLNISDPNNSVETHNRLHQMMTLLRQRGIEDAKAKIKRAQEAKKEAEAYAEKAQYMSTVISVVMIAVTLTVTFLTMGAGAMLFSAAAMAVGAVVGAVTGGAEGALQGASIAGSLASFGAGAAVQAGAQAAKEIAKQIADQLVTMAQDMAKNFAKMMTQLLEQSAKTAAEMGAEAVKNVSKEAAQKLAEQVLERAKQLAQEQIGTAINDLTQQQLQAVMDQASKEVVANARAFIQEQAQNVVEQVAKEAAMQGKELSKEALAKLQNEVAESIAKEIQKMAKEGAIAGIERGVISKSTGRLIQTAANAAGQVVSSGATMTANEKVLAAQQQSIEAKRMRMLAEMMQQTIEEENKTVQMIMESKNQVVDAVIQMMNAMFASSQKLMSAGMAK